jgi:hypothetical protein
LEPAVVVPVVVPVEPLVVPEAAELLPEADPLEDAMEEPDAEVALLEELELELPAVVPLVAEVDDDPAFLVVLPLVVLVGVAA